MKGFIFGAALVGAVMCVAGCSAITKQETTQSNLPTAESLIGMCKNGLAATPPVRVGACDDYDLIASACQNLAAQPLIPAQSLLACTANGYAISGGFTRL